MPCMARIRTIITNWIIGFVFAYAVVSRFRGRSAGLKAGLAWGSLSAVLALGVARRLQPGVSVEIGDQPEAEAATAD